MSRDGLQVHLVDGTYELFRHFFGQPPRGAPGGTEVGAALGVATSLVSMLAAGATHIGVATDHVIESFRNDMWPTYKTGAGVPQELLDQFGVLEILVDALGVTLWPMVELEADDAMASAAHFAKSDPRVDQVLLCTPDKDLAQCVEGRKVVQLDRRTGAVTDEEGVWTKFGVAPVSIPDWLALVGDNADGFPGLSGWGKKSASSVLAHYVHLSEIPDDVAEWDDRVRNSVRSAPKLASVLAAERDVAELFLDLATLRTETVLLSDVDELEWTGPTEAFADVCAQLGSRTLAGRAASLAPRS
ncbi:MAG: 5'-3' exonuclease H3TH domain-containing protein [Acidimicrobiales bacterium]